MLISHMILIQHLSFSVLKQDPFWDYGQVDQETFKVVLGPTPQNTNIRATSQPDKKVEHLSIIEKKLKALLPQYSQVLN